MRCGSDPALLQREAFPEEAAELRAEEGKIKNYIYIRKGTREQRVFAVHKLIKFRTIP